MQSRICLILIHGGIPQWDGTVRLVIVHLITMKSNMNAKNTQFMAFNQPHDVQIKTQDGSNLKEVKRFQISRGMDEEHRGRHKNKTGFSMESL